jgi:hypothetical protein
MNTANTAPRFRWTCSYMNTVDYEVCDASGVYAIEMRRGLCDYEIGITRPQDIPEKESAIGILRRRHGIPPDYSYELPQSVVDAFNKWQADKHAAWIANMKAQPDRYGTFHEGDPLLVPPMVARRGRWIRGQGWIDTDSHEQAAAA